MILADFVRSTESSNMSQDQQGIDVFYSNVISTLLTEVGGLDEIRLLELEGSLYITEKSSSASKLKDLRSMPMNDITNLVSLGLYNYRLENNPAATRLSTDTAVYIFQDLSSHIQKDIVGEAADSQPPVGIEVPIDFALTKLPLELRRRI